MKASSSFLKKRTKKLLSPGYPSAERSATALIKVFLLLFFQKKQALLFLCVAFPALAEPVTPPEISPPDTWQPRQSGTLRLLNKLDSTTNTLTMHVGETQRVESLSITLKACDVRPPDLPQDATAQLTVVDSREGAPGFDGWILANEPAAAMLEHPVYDIRLAGCA